jgi:IS5 family transposase
MFARVNELLREKGLLLRQGTLVDATLIAAPPSTKNATGQRDPAMHQAKKGQQWHFGMKAHIGADMESGLVHTVVGTAANVHDVTQAHVLLHGHGVSRSISRRNRSRRVCLFLARYSMSAKPCCICFLQQNSMAKFYHLGQPIRA